MRRSAAGDRSSRTRCSPWTNPQVPSCTQITLTSTARSSAEITPNRRCKRCLLAVVIWSAITLRRSPFSITRLRPDRAERSDSMCVGGYPAANSGSNRARLRLSASKLLAAWPQGAASTDFLFLLLLLLLLPAATRKCRAGEGPGAVRQQKPPILPTSRLISGR